MFTVDAIVMLDASLSVRAHLMRQSGVINTVVSIVMSFMDGTVLILSLVTVRYVLV